MRNYSYHSNNRESLLDDNFNSLHLTTFDSEQSSSTCKDSSPTTKNHFFHNIPFPLSRTVYYDQFLDIQCNYLSPTDLNDTILGVNSNDLTIYHNNIRSLKKISVKCRMKYL